MANTGKKNAKDVVLAAKNVKELKELSGHIRRLLQLDANPEVVRAETLMYAGFVEAQLARCSSSLSKALKEGNSQ